MADGSFQPLLNANVARRETPSDAAEGCEP